MGTLISDWKKLEEKTKRESLKKVVVLMISFSLVLKIHMSEEIVFIDPKYESEWKIFQVDIEKSDLVGQSQIVFSESKVPLSIFVGVDGNYNDLYFLLRNKLVSNIMMNPGIKHSDLVHSSFTPFIGVKNVELVVYHLLKEEKIIQRSVNLKHNPFNKTKKEEKCYYPNNYLGI